MQGFLYHFRIFFVSRFLLLKKKIKKTFSAVIKHCEHLFSTPSLNIFPVTIILIFIRLQNVYLDGARKSHLHSAAVWHSCVLFCRFPPIFERISWRQRRRMNYSYRNNRPTNHVAKPGPGQPAEPTALVITKTNHGAKQSCLRAWLRRSSEGLDLLKNLYKKILHQTFLKILIFSNICIASYFN